MTSRLCGCSFICRNQTLEEGLKAVKSLGFTHVDVGLGGANRHFNPIEVAQQPEHWALYVQQALQSHQLHANECFLLNFGWPINTPDIHLQKQTTKLFTGLCEFAAQAGFTSVLLIPGPTHDSLGQEKSLDLSVNILNELQPIAAQNNLRLHVEADVDSCANHPILAEVLCKRVNNIWLTLDYSHFACQNIPANEIQRLHPYVRHLHIRQAALNAISIEPHKGDINYATVISQLEKSGYQGLYCIEYLSATSLASDEQKAMENTTVMAGYVKQYLQEGTFSNED